MSFSGSRVVYDVKWTGPSNISLASYTKIGIMGCRSVINGLQVALASTKSAPNDRDIPVAMIIRTRQFQFALDQKLPVANLLFVDEVVVPMGHREPKYLKSSDPIHSRFRAMTWDTRKQDFDITIQARPSRLMTANPQRWTDHWLRHSDLEIRYIRY